MTLLLEPSPRSFAPRTLDELLSTLDRLGLDSVREGTGRYRIEHPELGRLQILVEEEGGELCRLRLQPAGSTARRGLLTFARDLAGPLNWEILDVEKGTRLEPGEIALADTTPIDRILRRSRAALTAIGAALAVIGGLNWWAQGGGQSLWLAMALAGLGLYFALRASAWIGSRLRHPVTRR